MALSDRFGSFWLDATRLETRPRRTAAANFGTSLVVLAHIIQDNSLFTEELYRPGEGLCRLGPLQVVEGLDVYVGTPAANHKYNVPELHRSGKAPV
jgi:hypothetical protein